MCVQLLGGLGFLLTSELSCVSTPAARMSPQPCPQANTWLEPGWMDIGHGCCCVFPCSLQNGVFPHVFHYCDHRLLDGSILLARKKQVETMKALSKKLGLRKVVLMMGNSASARVPNLLTQAG